MDGGTGGKADIKILNRKYETSRGNGRLEKKRPWTQFVTTRKRDVLKSLIVVTTVSPERPEQTAR